MEAVVLAGGFGTRLRPLTYTRPKPLLPIANVALIDHVLEAIPRSFDTVLIPVNYRADMIREHFQFHPDKRVVLVDEPNPLGSAGAIKNCQRYITGPFLVFNADIVSTLDVRQLVEAHVRRRAAATISLWPVEEPWHYGVVQLGTDDRIVRFVEKPARGSEPSRLINAGHYMVDPSLLDRVPDWRFMSLEREVFERVAAEEGAIHGQRFQGFWVDCGRPENYLEAHRLILQRDALARVRGDRVAGLEAGRFVSYAVGDGVRLGRRSTVERSVLLGDVEVGERTSIVDSVVGEGARLGAGSRLTRCVVADGTVIPPGTQATDERVGMRPEHEATVMKAPLAARPRPPKGGAGEHP